MDVKNLCATIATSLHAYGISTIVVSPGSRNAPIIEAINSHKTFDCPVIVDERDAAFYALGVALIQQKPVALVCTSGTACLNYAPAVAEAFYRNIPLIVITADRPAEWIDRNDAQTIKQQGIFGNFIKDCYNISSRSSDHHVMLSLNDALCSSMILPHGPVHINVGIENPTVGTNDSIVEKTQRPIALIQPEMTISRKDMDYIIQRIKYPARVMIVAGVDQPSEKLNRAINKISSFGNIIVLADTISNIHGSCIINNVDTLLSEVSSDILKRLMPDIVISHGGPILSAKLKNILRQYNIEHWHVGLTHCAQDTFHQLSLRIETTPEAFYRQIAAYMRRSTEKSTYCREWLQLYNNAISSAVDFIDKGQWSDLIAVSTILKYVPKSYNIQFSNGMSVRYGQVLPYDFHRVDCNRGVSGIDGSTATAIGAATAYAKSTILITGDMSAAYDIGALSIHYIPSNFKMVIVVNGGGGIFRYIESTKNFVAVDKYMVANPGINFKNILLAYGFDVFEADSKLSLVNTIKPFLCNNHNKAALIIYTDSEVSASTMTEFTNRTVLNKN